MDQIQRVAKTIQLVLLYFWVANFLDFAKADPPYPYCSNTSNQAANTLFQNNLNNLLFSLYSNSSVSKLYNSTVEDSLNQVYGQYMCLNYLPNDSCSKCIHAAKEDITEHCTNSTEAIIWEENCQLRYSNLSFLGQLDLSGNLALDNKRNVSNPEKFRSVVNQTVRNLIKQAAFNTSVKMYATGETAFTDTETLYALVQCTTDLSSMDCNTCLQIALENVSSCYYFSRGARLLSRSCHLRYELYAFYKGEDESPVSGGKLGTQKSSKGKKLIKILASSSAILVIASMSLVIYCLSMKKGKNAAINHEIKLHKIGDGAKNIFQLQHQTLQESDSLMLQESGFMDLASINAATDNFSELNKLGEGGFGPVYKGKLSDGSEVAVKRLSSFSEQGADEFINEVLLIMKLQHKNLVRLLGFCFHGEEKLLVYEFMSNSSLDLILFDARKRAQLVWCRRINIINGIAKGMLYLHEDSRLRIIHRDLKASNILLDNEMNPKISDFGMARIFASSEGEANTARIVGTYGYMAPEYAMEGLYSSKSDVFSFGVLLLEIITGRKNTRFSKSNNPPSLTAYAWHLWNRGNEVELMDPLLADACVVEDFSKYMNIGLLCVQGDACDRPTMDSVVLMLKSETTTLPQPEKPAFSLGRFSDQLKATCTKDCSSNDLTISISPR